MKDTKKVAIEELSANEIKDLLEELLFKLGYEVHKYNCGYGPNYLGKHHKQGGPYSVFLAHRNVDLIPVEAKFKEES